ncbi:MAG: glycoside hydrolase family 76 protein [Myxococcales bacterium]
MTFVRAPGLHAGIAVTFAAALLFAPTAHAEDHGEAAYNAWTAAFLVKGDLGNHKGMTFFAKSLTGPDHKVPDDNWRLALDIMVVADTYLHTRKPEQLILLDTLLGDYMKFNGTDYSGDQWNDDLGWISIAFIRGYQLTGQQKYLDMSAKLWNLAYDRGWDSELGGGIWENKVERPGKEALSNNPFIISGIALYEATKDQAYLTKATAIYDWVRKNLFDAKTGRVNQGLNPPNTLNPGGNVYNSGTFIIAANNLYRVLGTTSYRDDAQKAIDFVLAKGPILRDSDNTQNALWAYWFIKGLTEFCAANDKWAQYQDYLDMNAQSSWANRDPKTNLTGNDWTAVYAYSDTSKVGPMPSNSGVAIWQLNDPSIGAVDAGPDAGAGGEDGGGSGTADGGSPADGTGAGAAGTGDAGANTGSAGEVDAGDRAAPMNARSSAHGSGCSCLLVAERESRGLPLAGFFGLLLFATRKRRRAARSTEAG